VADGGELGPVIDRFSGECNTKEHGGAVGFLTNNLFDRRMAWEMSVAYALAPFLKTELYGAKA
jgi:non-canonical (house-cleaning) NTP pyrophosphatase